MKLKQCVVAGVALAASSLSGFAAEFSQPVRSIDERGRIPYQKLASDQKVNSESANATFGAIPAGKRVVIEHVSIATQQSVNSQPILCSVMVDDSTSSLVLVTLDAPKQLTPTRKVVSQAVRAYADSQLVVSCTKLENPSGNAGLLSISAVVTGYLVNK
ncbi:MAG TPA: hypothetical protein VEQ63_06435 [Bryobacteraceae bacterium]|nr:hypothetical protein [Bryobacteraceae bacterium]